MPYKVEFTSNARRILRKLEPSIALRITEWIRNNLEGCENPREHAKPLQGNRKGQWSYRVGDYRIIAKIEDYRVIILVMDIGHRREIYK